MQGRCCDLRRSPLGPGRRPSARPTQRLSTRVPDRDGAGPLGDPAARWEPGSTRDPRVPRPDPPRPARSGAHQSRAPARSRLLGGATGDDVGDRAARAVGDPRRRPRAPTGPRTWPRSARRGAGRCPARGPGRYEGRVRLLPSRWVAFGFVNQEEVFAVVGRAIPADLELRIDSAGDRAWLTDYGTALELGMALEVELTGPAAGFLDVPNELFVVGIRAGIDAMDGGHRAGQHPPTPRLGGRPRNRRPGPPDQRGDRSDGRDRGGRADARSRRPCCRPHQRPAPRAHPPVAVESTRSDRRSARPDRSRSDRDPALVHRRPTARHRARPGRRRPARRRAPRRRRPRRRDAPHERGDLAGHARRDAAHAARRRGWSPRLPRHRPRRRPRLLRRHRPGRRAAAGAARPRSAVRRAARAH